MSIVINNGIAYLPGAGAAVTFTQPSYNAFAGSGSKSAAPAADNTTPALVKLITKLDVAPWGEDNRFPQNITAQLNYCGVAKSALDWKARALWGGGLMWGKVIDYKEDGSEVWQPSKPGSQPDVETFFRENSGLYRYFLESNQDWCHFGNIFPEYVMSVDGKKICRLMHQESCDCRFQQMDKYGRINSVLLSKLWGMVKDQFAQFDPKKAMATSVVGATEQALRVIDNKYIKQRRAIDPYNALEDLKAAVNEGHRNIIHPVQYPSPNKTYYQLAYWDGARMAGWVEIAAKIPGMMKVMYDKAFNIKYHIEIPETYMERRYGAEKWQAMEGKDREVKRQELLVQMDTFLSGADNAHKAFISYFDVSREGDEKGRIKITVIDNKSTIDKDLLASSAANSEILFAMQINPDLIGAGTPGGAYSGSAGSGSNIREAYLVYTSLLHLERQIILEPLRLIQQYNGWDPALTFRFRDVVLTTLDKNTGTEKKVS